MKQLMPTKANHYGHEGYFDRDPEIAHCVSGRTSPASACILNSNHKKQRTRPVSINMVVVASQAKRFPKRNSVVVTTTWRGRCIYRSCTLGKKGIQGGDTELDSHPGCVDILGGGS